MSDQQTLASIAATCPHCSKKFRLPSQTAGRKAKCSGCHEVFKVPALKRAKPKADKDVLRLRCPTCEKKLKVPAKAAGKRVRCPSCQAHVLVPSKTGAAQPPPPTPEPTESYDLLDGLDDGASIAPPPQAAAPLMACAKCSAAIAAGSPVCPSCGGDPVEYGLAGGEEGSGAAARLGALGGVLAGTGGRYLLGSVCSVIGALIGAGVWFGVAFATQYEIGWIAWGVGLLAGAGMAIGSRSYGFTTGLIASAAAVGGIVAAKATMFYMVFGPLLAIFSAIPDAPETPREAVIEHRIYLAIDDVTMDEDASFEDFSERFEQERQRVRGDIEREVDQLDEAALMTAFREVYASDLADADEMADFDETAFETDEAWDAAYEEAHQKNVDKHLRKLSRLSDEEVEQRWRTTIEERQELLNNGAPVLFFATMFGWMDLLFFVLAIGSAFKLGASGMEGLSG